MQSFSPGLQHALPSCSAFVKAQTVLVGTEDKGKKQLTIQAAGSKGRMSPLKRGRAGVRSRCLDGGIERGSGQRPEALDEFRRLRDEFQQV